MHIGILTLRLRIEGAESLKDKRQAIKSLVHRIRHRFNVSAAETGDLELWQRSIVGVAVVSNDPRIANQVLSQVVNHVENDFRVILDDYTVEMVMGGEGEVISESEEEETGVFEKWFEK
jgi:uncharacterized protein